MMGTSGLLAVLASAEGGGATCGRGGKEWTARSGGGGGISSRKSGTGSARSSARGFGWGDTLTGTVGLKSPAPRHERVGALRPRHPPTKGRVQVKKMRTPKARLRHTAEQCWGLFTVIFMLPTVAQCERSCHGR